jgi:hypothetical protein
MPADHVIFPAERLVLNRAWGMLTELEVREQCARVATDPRFESDYSQLADLTGVVSFDVAPKRLAESICLSLFDAGVRRAIVVSSLAQREAAIMIATTGAARGDIVRVFATVDSANRWLSA